MLPGERTLVNTEGQYPRGNIQALVSSCGFDRCPPLHASLACLACCNLRRIKIKRKGLNSLRLEFSPWFLWEACEVQVH
jgi:hypothetical protein